MATNLKVGDKVMINRDKCRWKASLENPVGVIGKVKVIEINHVGTMPIEVDRENGECNWYANYELDRVEEMSLKESTDTVLKNHYMKRGNDVFFNTKDGVFECEVETDYIRFKGASNDNGILYRMYNISRKELDKIQEDVFGCLLIGRGEKNRGLCKRDDHDKMFDYLLRLDEYIRNKCGDGGFTFWIEQDGHLIYHSNKKKMPKTSQYDIPVVETKTSDIPTTNKITIPKIKRKVSTIKYI